MLDQQRRRVGCLQRAGIADRACLTAVGGIVTLIVDDERGAGNIGVDRASALVDQAHAVATDGADALDGIVDVDKNVGAGAAAILTVTLDIIVAGTVRHGNDTAATQLRAADVKLQGGDITAAIERDRAGVVDRALQHQQPVVVDIHVTGAGDDVPARAVKHALVVYDVKDAATRRFKRAAGDERALQADIAAIGRNHAANI